MKISSSSSPALTDRNKNNNEMIQEALGIWRQLTVLTQRIGKETVTYRITELQKKRKRNREEGNDQVKRVRQRQYPCAFPQDNSAKCNSTVAKDPSPESSSSPSPSPKNQKCAHDNHNNDQQSSLEPSQVQLDAPSCPLKHEGESSSTSLQRVGSRTCLTEKDAADLVEFLKVKSMKRDLVELLRMQKWFYKELADLPRLRKTYKS